MQLSGGRRRSGSRLTALLPYKLSIRFRRRRSRTPEFIESDANVKADEYIAWLCRVNGGWLDAGSGNLRAMDHAVRQMPDGGSVLEIGSFLGASLNVLTYLTLKYGRANPVFSCDPWDFEQTEEPVGGFFDASAPEYREYAREAFRKNVELFSAKKLPHAVEDYSDSFFRDWRKGARRNDLFGRGVQLGGPLSFAYIDGAHTYEASMADFQHVDAQLQRGGFVLLDDSEDDGPFESTRTAQEAAARPDYDLVFKSPNYLLRKR